VILIETGTIRVFDALMCPYDLRAGKSEIITFSMGMPLMWDKGLHIQLCYKATLVKRCDYRIPANVKFWEKNQADGSYLRSALYLVNFEREVASNRFRYE